MRFWAKSRVVAEVEIGSLKSIILQADAHESNAMSRTSGSGIAFQPVISRRI